MKKLLTIATIFLLFFIGCSDQNNTITEPSQSTEQLSKIRLGSDIILPVLPTKILTITDVVIGAIGGIIKLESEVLNSDGKLISTFSELTIPAGAFEGTEKISLIVNVDDATISFYPHMNFKRTCYLNFHVKNLNLYKLGFKPTDKRVNFVYFDDSGSIEPITNAGTYINFPSGLLKVESAEINHFSRYGFVR